MSSSLNVLDWQFFFEAKRENDCIHDAASLVFLALAPELAHGRTVAAAEHGVRQR